LQRRNFLALVRGGAVSLLAPLSATAQQGQIPVIGVLVLGTPPPDAFLKGLNDELSALGYNSGRNMRLEIRTAGGNANLLAEKAAELVRLKVNLIVAFQTLPATAARQATTEIPIVMGAVGDPVGTRLVDSLARPGGNVTGTAAGSAEVAGKTVELIREIIPKARRFAVLANETDPFTRPYLAENGRAAQSAGMEMETIMAIPAASLEAAFNSMIGKGIDAVVLQGSLLSEEAVELGIKHRLPVFSSSRLGTALGCLASYTANFGELFRQTASYIDKILKGERPGDLPVSLPTTFELVINLKTAKAIGLVIPPTLIARADEVIE
jgi:putative ABC transport system substrate-binding protein